MIYKPKNSGFLSVENAKDGEIVKLVEDAFESFSEAKQTSYLNIKVELPDGTQKLASIDGNFGGDAFADMWGEETSRWVNHRAKVSVKQSKAGKSYIVLVPVAGDAEKVETPEPEPSIAKSADGSSEIVYPEESIDPESIPF